MSLIEIESTKDNHKSIFLLKSKQMISYIGWERNGEDTIVVSVEDSAGIKKDIHSFADIKDWVDKHDYDSTIKSDFRDYKGGD